MQNWRDIVADALRDLGGAASLEEVYSTILSRHAAELAPTWQATVRRTLGDHSTSSQHFRGEHVFNQIAPGRWALAVETGSGDPDGIEDDRTDSSPSERIAKPFDPLQIKISRRVVTIGQVVERIEFNEVELAPDFQRRARIWDLPRKSRLIESIMLRIPLPVFYVASDDEENWKVVDGLQRLTTIFDYVSDKSENRFVLSRLEYLSDYEGLYFDRLPRGIVRRISETELNINVIESGTPEQVMFNIFKRLNTGGLTLNSQEIRHALNPGPARDFLKRLSANNDFEIATDRSVSDNRMGARELALRFVAFHLTPYTRYAEDDLDGFLNLTMRQLNAMSEMELGTVETAFSLAMRRAYLIFGKDAFRKRLYEGAARNRVNRALFEAWSVALAKLGANADDALVTHQSRIRASFMEELLNDYDFMDSVSTSTGSRGRVIKRFATVESILEKALYA
jgi:hypothetical protein